MLLSRVQITGLIVLALGVVLQFVAAPASGSSMLGDAGLVAVVAGMLIEFVAFAIDDIPGR